MEENLTEVKKDKKGLSIASMVLGILSIVGMFIPFVPCLAVILAIISIILGIVGMKKGGKGFAIAGIIISAIVFVVDAIITIVEVVVILLTVGVGGLSLTALGASMIPLQDPDVAFEQGVIDESYFGYDYDEDGYYPSFYDSSDYDNDYYNDYEYNDYDYSDYDYEEPEEIDPELIYRSQFIFWDSDSRYLTDSEIEGLDADTLRIAINEIYARQGRMFDSPELKEYFENTTWYVPIYTPEEFEKIERQLFNDYEWENIQLMSKYREKLN